MSLWDSSATGCIPLPAPPYAQCHDDQKKKDEDAGYNTTQDQWIFVPFVTTVYVLQAADRREIVANGYLNTRK